MIFTKGNHKHFIFLIQLRNAIIYVDKGSVVDEENFGSVVDEE